LGFPIFEEIRDINKKQKEILYCKGKNAVAQGELIDDGFVVFKDSIANLEETNTAGDWVKSLRKKLINDKILIQENEIFRFTEGFVFGSPSAAAAVVLGRSANGWNEWKNSDKKTIDQIYRIENI
jgi:hypothetical protein